MAMLARSGSEIQPGSLLLIRPVISLSLEAQLQLAMNIKVPSDLQVLESRDLHSMTSFHVSYNVGPQWQPVVNIVMMAY